MEWLAFMVLGFAGLRLLVAIENWFFWPVIAATTREPNQLVSLLIPARNEASNLPALFAQLNQISYPNLEILILDDHSEDETANLVSEASRVDSRIRLLSGRPLPPDWLGKSWACHQLTKEAQGTYFLFLDADIHHLKPGLIPALIAEMQAKSLTLISIFPDQDMQTWGEKLVVPIMHELLLSLLPLRWIYALPFPSMAAANGQCMFFEANTYREQQWHQQVKGSIVEDIAIMRSVKASGAKGMTFVGGDWVGCRMYPGFRAAVHGFSRNLLAGFGNSIPGMLVYLTLVSVAWLAVFLYLPPLYWGIGFGLILLRRAAISHLAGQPILRNLLLHPFQMAAMVGIGCLSLIKRVRGTNTWKGRRLA